MSGKMSELSDVFFSNASRHNHIMNAAKTPLTPKQAAIHLKTTEATVRLWIAQGKVKAARPGGRWLIPQEEIDRLLSPVQVQPLPQTSAEMEERRQWAQEGIERLRNK